MDWDVATSIASLLQTGIFVGATAFAVYEYYLVRRLRPRIEFDVDFDTHCVSEQENRYLLIAKLEMTNTGSVRKYLPEIEIRATTPENDELEKASNRPKRVKFCRTLVNRHNIVVDPMDPWWIDPGIKQVIRHPIVIEKPGEFVCLDAQVFYYKPPRKREYLYRRHQELRWRRDEASKRNDPERQKAAAQLKRFRKDQIDYHRVSRIKPVHK